MPFPNALCITFAPTTTGDKSMTFVFFSSELSATCIEPIEFCFVEPSGRCNTAETSLSILSAAIDFLKSPTIVVCAVGTLCSVGVVRLTISVGSPYSSSFEYSRYKISGRSFASRFAAISDSPRSFAIDS